MHISETSRLRRDWQKIEVVAAQHAGWNSRSNFVLDLNASGL
jgi:hypothetical protein